MWAVSELFSALIPQPLVRKSVPIAMATASMCRRRKTLGSRFIDQLPAGLNLGPHIGIVDGARHHQVHRLIQDTGELLFQVEIGIHQSRGLQRLELHQQVQITAARLEIIPHGRAEQVHVFYMAPPAGQNDGMALAIPCYETPAGWKFFGTLLDAGRITVCGEESFGAGSDHVREKDGLWAVLFWLSILAAERCSVASLMERHWAVYGRHYYSRHDYEGVEQTAAAELYGALRDRLPKLAGQPLAGDRIDQADEFCYTDPVDGATSSGQGLRILLESGSRMIFRLSGTGTRGATLRLYLERHEPSSGALNLDPQTALAPLIRGADQLAGIRERTGMTAPTVIT